MIIHRMLLLFNIFANLSKLQIDRTQMQLISTIFQAYFQVFKDNGHVREYPEDYGDSNLTNLTYDAFDESARGKKVHR